MSRHKTAIEAHGHAVSAIVLIIRQGNQIQSYPGAIDLIHIVMFLKGNSDQKLLHWRIMHSMIKRCRHAHRQTSKWCVQVSSELIEAEGIDVDY